MKSDLIWFILGAFTSFVINLISPPIYKRIRLYIKKIIRLRLTKKDTTIILGPSAPKNLMKIGALEIDFFVLQYANYKPELIQSIYSSNDIPLIKEFEELKQRKIKEVQRRKNNGDFNLPYNGTTYKLLAFDVGSRELIEGDELPVLKLSFGPTDYFTQLVTDLNIKDPLRNTIASNYNILETPVSEFASILGVNFNLITKDGYLIITHRSTSVNVNGGIYHTSVAENLLRPTDADPNGAPDLFACAVRGIQEEIGIPVEKEKIEFTTFGVYPEWCQYKIIGWSQLDKTKDQVKNIHSLAVAKDKWENNELIFVPCNPNTISEFVAQTINNWYDIGLACVVLSLFQIGYPYEKIQEAFSQIKKPNSQTTTPNNI